LRPDGRIQLTRFCRGFQQVNDMFKLDWGTYLTTSEGVIYAVIDGRGSGFRGDDLLFELYYNVGGAEVEDQLDVTRQLLKRFAFLDRSRVAIWGWSYGGESHRRHIMTLSHTLGTIWTTE
jgi:dipeptidyl aminopeptidase/acylaminoacyl peptidase